MNPLTQRITALDYARAWAIFGMIIVNYKLAMLAENDGPVWLRAAANLFEGRASALFVVLAGFGISLMTAKAINSSNKDVIRQTRNTLYRRAVFLFISGLFLLIMGWSADILHYYAVFMLAASMLITVSDKLILCLSAVILFTSQLWLILFDYSRGWDNTFHEYTDLWTIQGFARNLIFNGFHPIFPWICFFLIGMWLGRKRWLYSEKRQKVLIYSLSLTVFFEGLSYFLIKWTSPILDTDSANYLFTTKPMPPTMLYVLSAASLAVAFITFCFYLVEKLESLYLTKALIHTGQLSLTHYIGHVLLGLGILEAVGYLENGSLIFAIAYGCGYFVFAIVFSSIWRKKIKRGPLELLMRKLS